MNNNNKGMTIVEVLASMAIIASVATIFVSAVRQSTKHLNIADQYRARTMQITIDNAGTTYSDSSASDTEYTYTFSLGRFYLPIEVCIGTQGGTQVFLSPSTD